MTAKNTASAQATKATVAKAAAAAKTTANAVSAASYAARAGSTPAPAGYNNQASSGHFGGTWTTASAEAFVDALADNINLLKGYTDAVATDHNSLLNYVASLATNYNQVVTGLGDTSEVVPPLTNYFTGTLPAAR